MKYRGFNTRDCLILEHIPLSKDLSLLEIGTGLGSMIDMVIDGLSEDGTREILGKYTEKYPFIKIIDNPQKIKPIALNIGIKNAKGEVIIRMDAHATYDKYYIPKCVEYLDKYKTDNVGGIRITKSSNNTVIGKAIAISISHPFSAGDAYYRTGYYNKKPKWVDTVFGGCYRREIFDKIGY